MMLPVLPPDRWLAAASLLGAWLALCAATVWRERRRLRAEQAAANRLLPADATQPPILVAHASQTGTAETLAWQTAQALQRAGHPTRITSLASVAEVDLAGVGRALFIVSTYGEGDPPDAAAPFARRVMAKGDLALASLHYAVLALGDRTYANFCGFGRSLDDWLAGHGAQPMFKRIDVDNGNPAAIADWRHHLGRMAGAATAAADARAWSTPGFDRWRLASRLHLNPGSAGEAVWHVELAPAKPRPLPDWQAGDLFQVIVPADPEHPREYSIASLPADGRIHLLVRLARRDDGQAGLASGWLIEGLALDGEIDARIREHHGFRLGDNAGRPLILIGNGTGLAGLRGLLKARAAERLHRGSSAPAWLIFGERNAAFDAFHDDDLERWTANGVLARCDRVYSRDQAERRYVQHRLAEAMDDVRRWVADGAAIYVCGSLEGMAAGVDDVLATGLGRDAVDELISTGRYRRDVY